MMMHDVLLVEINLQQFCNNLSLLKKYAEYSQSDLIQHRSAENDRIHLANTASAYHHHLQLNVDFSNLQLGSSLAPRRIRWWLSLYNWPYYSSITVVIS